jgi:hypothetical protein
MASNDERDVARPEPEGPEHGMWDRYWDRFRRQQVDDPIEERREGYWDRFRRQQVDDPVDERRRQRRSP